jgi:hypothetical protein
MLVLVHLGIGIQVPSIVDDFRFKAILLQFSFDLKQTPDSDNLDG